MLSSRSLKSAVLGLSLLAGGCDRQSGQTAQPEATASAGGAAATGEVLPGEIDRSHQGSAMPEFKLSDAGGKTITLASLKGKPLLINLWATWCAPCIAELPQLDAIAAAGKLRVLAVSQDTSKTEKVAPFLKDHGIKTLEPWLDPENELISQYNAGDLPTSVLYDAGGKEVWRISGPRDWSSKETATLLGIGG